MRRIDAGSETLIPIGGFFDVAGPLVSHRRGVPSSDEVAQNHLVAHSLRADGFDASEDGTGRGTQTLTSGGTGERGYLDPVNTTLVAFSVKDHCAHAGEIAPTLRSGGHDKSHANGGVMPAIAFDARQSDVLQYGEKTGPLDTDGHTMGVLAFAQMQVRRLTPVECARLQGFPDTYLDITYRGKPAADGNKYKALGNSMAVPVMHWIGRRITTVVSA